MDLLPSYLQISEADRQQIEFHLTTLPSLRGKISVTFEFNCPAPGVVGAVKVYKNLELLLKR